MGAAAALKNTTGSCREFLKEQESSTIEGNLSIFEAFGENSHAKMIVRHKSQVTGHKSQVTSYKSQVTIPAPSFR